MVVRWILSVCMVIVLASATSSLSAMPPAAKTSIGERIALRKILNPIMKTSALILFCTSIGCGGKAVVEHELAAESPVPQVQTVEPDAQVGIEPRIQTEPNLQERADWPKRMLINNMGGILGADVEKYQAVKDSLPAEFYDRMFVFHQKDGLNHVNLVRPYSAFYPDSEKAASTLVAISNSGEPLDYTLDTSDIREILIADHPAYKVTGSAVIPYSMAIPLGGKKLPPGYEDLYIAGDIYMVLNGNHLMIRGFAIGELGAFKEITKPIYVLGLKANTLVMQLRKKNDKPGNKPNRRTPTPFIIAQANE